MIPPLPVAPGFHRKIRPHDNPGDNQNRTGKPELKDKFKVFIMRMVDELLADALRIFVKGIKKLETAKARPNGEMVENGVERKGEDLRPTVITP